ncbi:MAG: PAS domain-containing sensor histidine kinase [Terriglobia bacterium]|jgi:PAS domain S-box-containing protein
MATITDSPAQKAADKRAPAKSPSEGLQLPRHSIEPGQVEKQSLDLFLLTLGMVLILTLGLAILMVPVVFWQRPTDILQDVWRKGFYGFLVLSLLFDAYLIQRQLKLRQLRRLLAQQRSDQELLLAAKKMDEALLHSIGEGVFAVDSEGRLILLNRRAQEWTGVEARDAISKPHSEVLHFEGQTPENFVEHAVETGQGLQVAGDAALVRPGGSRMPVSILAAPVIQDGRVRGSIIIFRDTSEQRALDQMKDEFISIASHQLRTPLAGLRWYASTLTEGIAGRLSPQQNDLVKEMESCVVQMTTLVNNLLDVARLDQGTLTLNHVEVQPRELLAEVVSTLESKAKRLQVSLRVDGDGSFCPPLRADKALLTEVLRNLVDNAIKYTPEHGVVKLRAQHEGQSLAFSVSDTGVGIPEESIEKLFRKFSRVENPLSKRERGSGLGLYFAKGIVEKHGGTISAQSIPGQGSTFYVRLPT